MLDQLKAIIGKVLPGVDMNTVTESTRLIEDLGFDSLALMMMSMEIEDAFDSLALMMMSMEIEDAFGFRFKEFVRFETVGDVCSYLSSRV